MPLEEILEFASTETATNADLEALLSLRNGDEPDANTLDVLDRLEGLGWVQQDADGTLDLTTIGRELLRHRLA